MDEKQDTPASSITKQTQPRDDRFSLAGFGLHLPPRYRHFSDVELKSLVAELQAYELTADGLPLKITLKGGVIEVVIKCTKEEHEALTARRAKRCECEDRKREEVARLRRREARTRDYTADRFNRCDVAVMQKKGTA